MGTPQGKFVEENIATPLDQTPSDEINLQKLPYVELKNGMNIKNLVDLGASACPECGGHFTLYQVLYEEGGRTYLGKTLEPHVCRNQRGLYGKQPLIISAEPPKGHF